jgi:hypothetical protein
MSAQRTVRIRQSEAGIALLISIFVLLLISVVAIALVVSSSTESALAGNYRSATGVYYAALSGLEEARGRLILKNPDAFGTTDPTSFLPPAGTALNMGDTYYLINPLGGEVITPWDSASTYPDNQFVKEFGPSGFAAPTNPSPTAQSVWKRNPLQALNLPGQLYKWVRINAVSEQSTGVDADADGLPDSTTPLYYDGLHFSNNSSAGPQVLELTSFAILPNGSQKILQYLAAPVPVKSATSPLLPAAVTLDGSTPTFKAPNYQHFWVRGDDQGTVGTCNPNPTPAIAMGYTTGSLSNFLQPPNGTNGQGISVASPDLRGNYTNGVPTSNPNIVPVTLSANLQTVAGLNALVRAVHESADVVINRNATAADMPAGMSLTNPMTIFINGDLTLSSWHSTGYGLLLVTGQFTYDPDASWDGLVLVIGKGMMRSYQGAYTDTQILGAVLLARTLYPDPSTTPLPPSSPPGSPNFDFTYSSSSATTNFGVYYSSCWFKAAMNGIGYQVLSFHEVSQ